MPKKRKDEPPSAAEAMRLEIAAARETLDAMDAELKAIHDCGIDAATRFIRAKRLEKAVDGFRFAGAPRGMQVWREQVLRDAAIELVKDAENELDREVG